MIGFWINIIAAAVNLTLWLTLGWESSLYWAIISTTLAFVCLMVEEV